MRLSTSIAIIGLFHCFSSHGQVGFTDVAADAGIDFVAVFSGDDFPAQGGVAWFDHNLDGYPDIFLTGGLVSDAFYVNDGDGTFTERTSEAGFLVMSDSAFTTGVVTGDIDNDGYREVFITTDNHDSNYLFYNNGDGTFTDISSSAGLLGVANSASACFGDYNKDGFLDLYVTNWCEEFSPEWQQPYFPTTQNYFYVNNGDLSFSEMAVELGVADSTGCGLTASFTDFDNDGDVDLLVGNDFGPIPALSGNMLFQNQYPLDYFSDVSNSYQMNEAMHSMGIAIGDYDEDDDLDYYITDIADDGFFRNEGNSFSDVLINAGLENQQTLCLNGTQSEPVYGWSCGFLDYDNDSYLDLFVANGDIPIGYPHPCLDSCKLFRNNDLDGTFIDVSLAAGIGDTDMSRGSAFADFDGDGDQDILLCISDTIIGSEKNVRLFQNNQTTGNWLSIALKGTISNADAFGSRVEIMFDNRKLIRECDGGSGFLSHNSSIIHFGLGSASVIDTVRVKWLSGQVDEYYSVGSNQHINIEELGGVVSLSSIQEPQTTFSAFPNPVVNGMLNYSVTTNASTKVSLQIIDLFGRLIHVMANQHASSLEGVYHFPDNISAGVYQLVLVENEVVSEVLPLVFIE